MNIHPDFEELLRLLEEREIEYMIVGGYAVAYHGHPRFTKDIGLTDLVKNKKATPRAKDKGDVEELGQQ